MAQSFWEANLAAVRRRNPALADALIATPSTSEQYIAGQALNGALLIGVRLEDGRAVSLSDPQQPQAEAMKWAQALGAAFHKGACVVLLGFGDGYYAEALYEIADDDTIVWLIEPDLTLLRSALQVRDLSALLQSPRIHFVSGLPAQNAAQQLFVGDHADRIKAQGVKMASTAFANHLYPQYVKAFQEGFSLALQMEAVKFKTWEEHADLMFTNVIANLPAVVRGAPVNRLLSKAVGETALVIAPGPSLDEALPLIKEIQDRVLLIAVDTAHRIMLKHGIHADLVVSIDFTDLNEKHFEGISDPSTCLVAFPAIARGIPARYEGRAYYYDHAGVQDSAGANPLIQALDTLGPLGKLLSQGSTAHAAYHLARLMGCSPIVLVGNDLGFPNNRFYADGAMQNDLDQPERDAEPLLDVASNDGGTIKTNGLYKIYLDGFRDLIQETRGVVINTSSRGARIENCPYQTLQSIIERHAFRRIDKSFIQSALHPTLYGQRHALAKQVASIAKECRNARQDIRRSEKKLQRLNPNDERFRAQIAEFMKEFQQAFRRHKQAVTLGLSLCPRSYFSVVNKRDDAGFGANASLKERQLAHQRYLDLFADLSKTLRRISTELEGIGRQL
ncbi:MAG: DUF115 domain-containing protein [Candidatus Hinthialibacter antarcticus]|nr:DUF115 domain-containing protein [Candidatus Hinthialibacter antarcticus]